MRILRDGFLKKMPRNNQVYKILTDSSRREDARLTEDSMLFEEWIAGVHRKEFPMWRKKEMLERIQQVKESLCRFGVNVGTVARDVCTFEVLGLSTALLPALIASAGFFIGKTVSPSYFYVVVAVLSCVALATNWRRGFAYCGLIAFCSVMTAYTFSYTGTDAQTCYFPMQYLLRHGWNPVFDSTVEKFTELAGDAQLLVYHTLFLQKFSSLCGAITASALGLFSGDGFLGYVLIVCLFSTAMMFAKRYWSGNVLLGVLFASGLTFSTKITSFLAGQFDYVIYASFCISALMLLLYARDRRLSDLVGFAVSTCICMSSKPTGVSFCAVLVLMTMPLLYRRRAYWRTLFGIGVVVVLVGASPLLTAWIQYGSPFYPSMTFNPNVEVVDITSDFTGNADALSMGYLSRVCYAWVSPKLTVVLVRLLEGNPNFSPVFGVCGGVAGVGLWFNCLLALSVVLLAASRKNTVTWLCVIIFLSANFAPLKYIGYSRYFPQIWAIFPLSVMNFICTAKNGETRQRMKTIHLIVSVGLVLILSALSGLSLLRTLAYEGRMLAQENVRQALIATFPRERPVRVDGRDYRFTTVKRFEQAGVRLVKSTDGEVDTVMQGNSALPCHDTHPEVYEDLNSRFPICDGVKTLLCTFRWSEVLQNIPHVLWD